ncbi:glutamyl-tRNA(Gln) amidotransferase subunit E [bacterium BMS3Abin05]|nr:glutamyl-tRNA(Gln) amidotransferase subunit E [bacterium BMS3Abin05]GBE26747.1 glutamyl-tRNA(Gln) amidotransferase subunit E [bacterium BMS3Bbin03]HDZ13219.1 GatB/YqeY domain-containing protein [Bacteroidota bacterium]
MSLADTIMQDLKAAMKAREKNRVDVLRLLKARIKNLEIDKGRALTGEEEIQVLQSAAKKRKEAIDLYEKGNRPELAEKEREELAVIQSYLPEQLSREDVEREIVLIVEETGASSMKDLGKVMKEAMARLKGKADGKLVQEIVRSKLE